MPHEDQITRASNFLLDDEIVAMPTETVYGLAARISSDIALRKIFQVKERPFFDPLIVHISDFSQLKVVSTAFESDVVKKLAEKFWPGPLSIILPKQETLNPLITSGLDTVAVRMPRHEIALQLIDRVGEPLAAPSANKFGKTSPTSASHVQESFSEQNIFILDGADSEIGIESTVIRPSLDPNIKQVSILRPGFISATDLKNCLGVNYSIVFEDSLSSPGNIQHHYMPDAPLALVDHVLSDHQLKFLEETLNKDNLSIVEIDLPEDGLIAARQVYAKLRQSAEQNPDVILFSILNRKGELWEAIFDRLKRAATFNFSSL